MATHLDQTSVAYRLLIRRLAEVSPTYKILDDFVNVTQHTCKIPAKASVISINSEGSDGKDHASIKSKEFAGSKELAQYLSSPGSAQSCRLFLIENICPDTTALLGGHFDIDPQFFADHIDNTSWYRIVEVADHIPALPSSKKSHDFLQLRHIETRIFSESETFKSIFDNPCQEADIEAAASSPNSGYEPTTVLPDLSTTRVARKAGMIIPKPRKKVNFEPLLFTSQVVTAWFQKKNQRKEGWAGVILLDPPFELPRGSNYLRATEYRSFLPRPSLRSPSIEATHTHLSLRQAIVSHLSHRLSNNQSLLNVATSDCFFILQDIYKLVASEWVVLDEYVNRELATIEYNLEKEIPSFRELDGFLKYLYIYKRHTARYHELITEAKMQCSERGQQCWPSDPSSTIAADRAQDLTNDFTYLQKKTQGTIQRIEKDMDLLTALVAIGEGERALAENRGVARLTLLATFFLPFSTVATILSMQGNFAPGATQFWIFWAVSLPIILLVGGFFNFQHVIKLG